MTKAEVVKIWRREILPLVKQEYEQDGIPDYPARREAWNNWTDHLCKTGLITLHQYENWVGPPENNRRRR